MDSIGSANNLASGDCAVTKGYFGPHGFAVPVAILARRFGGSYGAFLKKLVITHRPSVGPPVVTKCYRFGQFSGSPCVFLPRTLLKTLVAAGILGYVEISMVPICSVNLPLGIKLYANQLLLIDYLCGLVFTSDRLADGRAACILNLKAGLGKTFVAAGIIARLGLRSLYVVPKRPLATQCINDLRGCFYSDEVAGQSAGDMLISKYGKHDSVQLITAIVINTAVKQPPEFFAKYSLIILDEVHMYCSQSRRKIFHGGSRAVLGLTATSEDRTDGLDIIAHRELAFDGIIRAESIPGFTCGDAVFITCARIIRYNGPPEFTRELTHEATGRVFTHYMHNQYIADTYRLKLAVSELIALYDWTGGNDGSLNHCVYVFAEELGILRQAKAAVERELAARLRSDIICAEDGENTPSAGLEMFTGGLNDSDAGRIKTTARVLFSTYSYAGTGISITRMTAIMFLTPRKAGMKQIIARILRRGSNLAIPRIVVDIVDNQTSLRHQLSARKLAYLHYGFTVEETKVWFDHRQPAIHRRGKRAGGFT